MATSRSPVGVALVGVGSHARRNALPALAACEAVRLVGVHGRDPGRRAEEARRWGCEDYPTLDALLADARVEAVYVALPVGLHAEACARSLAAGRHVWCEKSLAATLGEAAALLELARASDLALCECFMYRHHEQFARLRERLRGGAIGPLKAITARFGMPHLAPDNVRYSRALGGGALLDLGCYTLNIARALSGAPLRSAHAALEREGGYEVDTGGAALLRFDGGLTAQLSWGFGRHYRSEVEVWGEGGTLSAQRAFSKPAALATALVAQLQAGGREEETIAPHDHFVAMFRDLAAALDSPEARAAHRREADEQARWMDALRRGVG